MPSWIIMDSFEYLWLDVFQFIPHPQNIFILNVLLNDLAIAVIGGVRGLGIINRNFIGAPPGEETHLFCYIYTLIAQIFWWDFKFNFIITPISLPEEPLKGKNFANQFSKERIAITTTQFNKCLHVPQVCPTGSLTAPHCRQNDSCAVSYKTQDLDHTLFQQTDDSTSVDTISVLHSDWVVQLLYWPW